MQEQPRPVPAERAAAPGRGVTGRGSGEQTLWIETCLEPTGRPACKEAPRATGRPQNVPRERTTEPHALLGGGERAQGQANELWSQTVRGGNLAPPTGWLWDLQLATEALCASAAAGALGEP